MSKKIVVVGGGISGLTAGIYALKAGFRAEIYEKNEVPGGECTGWDRKGYHIDNCIHWLMGASKGSALHKIYCETGALSPDVPVITSEQMYTSELSGKSLTLWRDKERTKKEMLSLSPEDQEEIEKLFRAITLAETVTIPAEKPAELMGPFDLIRMGLSSKNALLLFKEYEGMDTFDLMQRFKSPLIRCLISDFCTKESLAHSFPMAYGNFTSGDGGIPKGGSRAMALRMAEKFCSLGGKLFTGMSVEKILHAEGKATKILLSNGEEVSGDYFILSCDPDYTFQKLLSPDYMDDVFEEVYKNRESYPVYGMFQAAFGVDSATFTLPCEVILPSGSVRTEEFMSDRLTLKTYSYEPSFSPEGKQQIQALLGLSEDGYHYFLSLYQDPEKYKQKKQEISHAIMLEIEKRFPEYEGKLTLLDSWTPITYKRYCNAFKGYNQAYMITKKSRKNPYPSAYLKGISNVILSGQWLSAPGGIPGAAIQGKYAVQRILKKEKRKINI